MSASADIFAANSIVWPMTVILMGLFGLKWAENSLRPVFSSFAAGVAQNASTNATFYMMAMLFGLSASLSAFYDVFSQLDDKAFTGLTLHQYAALWAKVLNPFIVAVLAYTRDSGKDKRTATNPPFAPLDSKP